MTKPKFETVNLPIAEMPKGRGWEIVTGSLTHNLWRRPNPNPKGPTRKHLVDRITRRAYERAHA